MNFVYKTTEDSLGNTITYLVTSIDPISRTSDMLPDQEAFALARVNNIDPAYADDGSILIASQLALTVEDQTLLDNYVRPSWNPPILTEE